MHHVLFSPDSKHTASIAYNDGKWLIVVDGVEAMECGWLLSGRNIIFDSPNKFHVLSPSSLVEIEITE